MNDLISRQDVFNAITKSIIQFGSQYTSEQLDMWGLFTQLIRELPSAQKKGEWIFNPTDAIEMMFTKPKCSECGFESADGGNFCPNCGADMRKEVK